MLPRTLVSTVPASLVFACGLSAQPLPTLELGLLPGDLSVGAAVNSQQGFAAAKGGEQYLIAWTDYRARSVSSQAIQSDGDVFGIRVDEDGNAIDAIPFLIAGGMGLQQKPRVAWNGENWLVLYTSQVPESGFFADRLRAVRVSPAGQVLDATPVEIPPTQFTPDTIGLQVAGLNGQWLVTRCVYHDDGFGTFLGGQRISGAGVLLDAAPCAADFDGNGTRDVADVFAFLAAWFAGEPAAYEFGGTPGVPAIFAFLTAWFAGC